LYLTVFGLKKNAPNETFVVAASTPYADKTSNPMMAKHFA
jgi:hypothetical protein